MKRTFLFLAIATLIGISACHPDPVLSVSPDSLSFPESGGSQTVQISANYPWTASVSGAGFSVSPSSGEGSGSVTVTAAVASSPDVASGTLNIRSEGLSASVSLSLAAKPTLILGDGAKVPAEGGTVEIPIQFNTDYTVEVEASAQSWIRFIRTKSLSSGRLELEISPNEGDERSGKVTVRDKGGKAADVSVTITQAAETKVLVVGDAAVVPAEGATVEVDVRYNVDYSVEVESEARSWIHYVETKSVKEGKLVFKVDANVTTDERTGKVTLKDKSGKVADVTVTFTQKGETKVLVVDDAATVSAEGGTLEIPISYNTDYTVTIEDAAKSWIRYVETKTVVDRTLVFYIDVNEGDERVGHITVTETSGDVDPVTITVTQKEKMVLNIAEPETVPSAGGFIQIPVEYNMDYSVNVEESARSWISVIRTKTVSNGQIELYVLENHGEERSGKVTVTAAGGEVSPIVLTIVQAADESLKIREILMKIYDAMDGPDWEMTQKWDLSKELNSWQGIDWRNGELAVRFNGFGLKGEFPDCFDELAPYCVHFWVQNEPDLIGTLPPSFSKLSRLRTLVIGSTSMTSLPDFFEGLPLAFVSISGNESMTGTVPESLGSSDRLMGDKVDIYDCGLFVDGNGFTGTVPESWLRLGNHLSLYWHKFTGQIPDYFYTSENAAYIINMYINEGQVDDYRETDPFSVKDYDIPGYWPEKGVNDVITGEPIPYDEIVARNKATVVFKWASWCGFSAALLPRLKKMHEKYHDDGLEVIARPGYGDHEGVSNQKAFIMDNGYDIWYNLSSDDIGFDEAFAMGEYGTPFANVIDSKGNIIFSCAPNVSDHSRGRFGYVAFNDLIPFLEDIFGPLEEEDDYSSTDYSMDGEVVTLQEASAGNGINIVFLGDAYTDREMKDGSYVTLMQQCMDEFFAIEPYKTFRDRFNVYAVKVVSENGKTGVGYSTALGCVAVGNSISIKDSGVQKSFEYALRVPGIKDKRNLLIHVLVNSSGRRGITRMSESLQSGVAFSSSTSNAPEFFGPVLRHEAGGHGFAFLADEYSNKKGSPDQEMVDEYNRLYREYGWYPNVDFTNDPAKVKWSAFLSDERYKDEVGIFEGGAAYYTKGVYRPSLNSMMNQDVEFFNAPSRWAIYKRIMELSGEEYSFETFLEYDAVNRGKTAAAAARPPLKAAASASERFEPSDPPVVMP
jgi:thiol-disulfide isomerase/thioredoxin